MDSGCNYLAGTFAHLSGCCRLLGSFTAEPLVACMLACSPLDVAGFLLYKTIYMQAACQCLSTGQWGLHLVMTDICCQSCASSQALPPFGRPSRFLSTTQTYLSSLGAVQAAMGTVYALT